MLKRSAIAISFFKIFTMEKERLQNEIEVSEAKQRKYVSGFILVRPLVELCVWIGWVERSGRAEGKIASSCIYLEITMCVVVHK